MWRKQPKFIRNEIYNPIQSLSLMKWFVFFFLLPHILLLVHAASKIIGRTELTNLPTKNNMRVTHDKFHIDDSCCFLLLFGSNFSSIRISYFEMKSLITTNERGGQSIGRWSKSKQFHWSIYSWQTKLSVAINQIAIANYNDAPFTECIGNKMLIASFYPVELDQAAYCTAKKKAYVLILQLHHITSSFWSNKQLGYRRQ